MNIYEKLWKSIKSTRMYWICEFWKKEMGYILYSKHINASHICPSKRNQLFKQRKWKSRFSGKHKLYPANYISKLFCLMKTWNDPTVITVILPQAIPHKPIIKVEFLTKALKSIFPKVWDLFPRQYSVIWRNSYGKFDENSIRTRLELLGGPEIKKIMNLYYIPQVLELGGRGASLATLKPLDLSPQRCR